MSEETLYYFAYGSNMYLPRVRARDRAPSARVLSRARLEGHVLRFHKRSRDGSAKCNAFPKPGAVSAVQGVLLEIAAGERESLHRAEGLGRGYEMRRVTVEADGARVESFTYVADPVYIESSLSPYDWYRALVLAGARQHGLPEAYIRAIEGVPAVVDPDRERRRRALRILERTR